MHKFINKVGQISMRQIFNIKIKVKNLKPNKTSRKIDFDL